jgi:hypothetical protein
MEGPMTTTASKSEFGLGLASFVVGTLLAIAVIPAALAAQWTSFLICIPFGIVAFTLGVVGRKTSLGLAGSILSLIALFQGVGFLGYQSHKLGLDAAAAEARLATAKLARAQAADNLRTEELKAEAQRDTLRIESEKRQTEQQKNVREQQEIELMQARTKLADTTFQLIKAKERLAKIPEIAERIDADEPSRYSDLRALIRAENDREQELQRVLREIEKKQSASSSAKFERNSAVEGAAAKAQRLQHELLQKRLANMEKERAIAVTQKPAYKKHSITDGGGVSVSQDNAEEVAAWDARIKRLDDEIETIKRSMVSQK